MRPFLTIAVAFSAAMASAMAIADEAMLQKGGVFCLSYSGAKSAMPSMNKKQLESLGCFAVDKDIPVWMHEPPVPSIYRQIDVTTPSAVFQGWSFMGREQWPGLVPKP